MERKNPKDANDAQSLIAYLNVMLAEDRTFETFLRCSRVVADFCKTSFIANRINSNLEELSKYPDRDSGYLSGGSKLSLLSGKGWGITSAVIDFADPTRKSEVRDIVVTTPVDIMMYVLGPTPIHVSIYTLPEHFDHKCGVTLPSHNRLTRRETVTLNPGEYIAVDSTTQTFSASTCSKHSTAIVKFQRQGERSQSYNWVFEDVSLENVGVASASVINTELELAAKALSTLECAPMFSDTLMRLSADKAHFVRWAAIQALSKADPTLCAEALQRALTDDHPQVRRKAREIL